MFKILNKIGIIVNFIPKINLSNIDYKYYLSYIKYLNILNYLHYLNFLNFSNKIEIFKNSIKNISGYSQIDKKLLNMKNWNLTSEQQIEKNLFLINDNITNIEYQIFTKVFFNELFNIDFNYKILFRKSNIPKFIKFQMINLYDILNSTNFYKYNSFIYDLFDYIVYELKDTKLFDEYLQLLIKQDDYLFVNYQYLIETKFIDKQNAFEIISSYNINSLYKKYSMYPVLRYKYIIGLIDLTIKFKKSKIQIKKFIQDLDIKDDYDFIIIKYWSEIIPSYKDTFNNKTSKWLDKRINYNN